MDNKRPVKWNLGMGFGQALQSGSEFYGQLALEKKNAEALAAARAEAVADKDEAYARQDRHRDEDNAAATAAAVEARRLKLVDLGDDRDYDATLTAEERTYQEERDAADLVQAEAATADERGYNERVLAEGRTYDEGQLTEQQAYDAERERLAAEAEAAKGVFNATVPNSAEDPTPVQRRFNAGGDVVATLGDDPDYVTTNAGEVARLSGGSTGRTDESQRMEQVKLELNARNMEVGLDTMTEVLAGDPNAPGYDLRSGGALADMVSDKIGGAANWLTSPEGQRFHAGLKMAGEGMFKGLSGAAGSDSEAARFYSMFPAPGDRRETVVVKMQMVETALAAFKRASGMSSNVDDIVMYTRAEALRASFEAGFNLDTGVHTPRTTTARPAQATGSDYGLSAEDMLFLNQ